MGFDRNVFNGTVEDLEAFAGAGEYGATVVSQSFSAGPAPLELEVGETITATFEFENSGTLPWDSQTLLGTTEPRDRESPFADDSWVAPNRVVAVDGSVAPGESYRFEFNLTAPGEPGEYVESFGLVQEGTVWFGDDGQAGPGDDALQVEITVVEPVTDPGTEDNETNNSSGTNNEDEGGDEDSTVAADGSVPPLIGTSPGVESGCSQTGSRPSELAGLLFAFVMLVGRRVVRRREWSPAD